MKSPNQAVKELAGKDAHTQLQIATHGLPYVGNPGVFDLARIWFSNLEHVRTKRDGKPVVVFRKPSKEGSIEASVVESIMDVIDLIHFAMETGDTRELRQFADAIQAISAERDDVDPLRAEMLRFARETMELDFYRPKTAPVCVPFTASEIAEHLAEVMGDAAPDVSEVRRTGERELGWKFKTGKRGPKGDQHPNLGQ
jgi:hypothetical protein